MPHHAKGSLWLVLLCLSAIQMTTGFVPVSHTNTHSRRQSLNPLLSEKTLKKEATTATTKDETDSNEPVGKRSKQTLYDILDVSPDATRAELKRSYVAMARQTHPDAMIGRNDTNDKSTGLEFAEIAAAYRVLSDAKQRKRYDRTLAAEAFTVQVEQMAAQVGKSAAPTAKRVIEKFAMPLFVRTATTTIASFSAAAEDLSKPNRTSVDLGSAVGAAFRAGQQAQRVIDRMDLLEKAEELEGRAAVETEKAMALKAELSELINKRLNVALRTPNSAISSAEALQILDSLNTIDSVSLVDRVARFKHSTLGSEIDTLEEAESDYYQTVNEHDEAKQHLFATQQAFVMAEQASENAIEAEIQAKKAYEEAQRRAITSKQEVMELTKTLASADAQQTKTAADLERCSLALERRQEKVRKALRKKEEDLKEKKKMHNNNNKLSSDSSTITTAEEATTTAETAAVQNNGGGDLAELKRLRQEEQLLTAESELVEEKAERLLSRAKKLKERCEKMDKK